MSRRSVVSVEGITHAIRVFRGYRVMLDADLARLYGVGTKRLNEAVKRHRARFPPDFMFQLAADEVIGLRSQAATLERGRGRHRKYLPYAFTEQGIAMLSSILTSPRAINVNIEIMRAFVRLRALLTTHADFARRLDNVEGLVFDAIRQLINPPQSPPRKQVGFRLRAT